MNHRTGSAPADAPRIAALAVWGAFVLIIPLAQGVDALLFSRARLGPGAWLGFAGTMAVVGGLAAALAYAAARRRGWLRSYLWGVVLALMMAPDADRFATQPVSRFLVNMVIVALLMGMVTGGIIHLLLRANRPR